MYTAKIENRQGDILTLTGNETEWQVASIVGLNPPAAAINTTPIVGLDGAIFNSSRLETRNIVITLRICGDAEANRLALYRAFPTKEWCRFYYENGSVDVYIDGYVESVECSAFDQAEQAQISILCPQPYFKSAEEIIADISSVTGLFTFPFTIEEDAPVPISSYDQNAQAIIENTTATPAGLIIEAEFAAGCWQLVISNETTGEAIEINHPFSADDLLTISTAPGEKSVRLTRAGTTTSIFASVALGSKFFQIEPGVNVIAYQADGGASTSGVFVRLRYHHLYRGV